MPSYSVKTALGLATSTQEKKEDKPLQISSQEIEKPSVNNAFTIDHLKRAYLQFVETIKDDKPRMYNTLVQITPSISNNDQISLLFINENQRDDFERTVKSDFVLFLRKELKNGNVNFEAQVTEHEVNNSPYTAEEKYKYFVQKNPNVAKFRQQFNLDFD